MQFKNNFPLENEVPLYSSFAEQPIQDPFLSEADNQSGFRLLNMVKPSSFREEKQLTKKKGSF